MATDAQIRANARYNKTHTKCVCLRLNLNTDADIIQRLAEVESKMGYIKSLIRKDMEGERE